MFERVLTEGAVLGLGAVCLGAFAIGTIVGLVRDEGGASLLRGLESGALAIAGGLLARTFVSVLLGLAGDTREAGLAVGLAFLVWPGLVDATLGQVLGTQMLTSPDRLLLVATTVGAFTGLMDGLWRIHDWRGVGYLGFPLDVTWGLAGTTNGCLLHLINFAWGDHGSETRQGTHRYRSGFGLKPGYAFTQGAAMSNLPDPPGSNLFAHERTHVWQNRAFGPIFTLTYVGWMAVWLLPGLVAGSVVGAGGFQGAEKWCYFNNPWETWAYAVGNTARTSLAGSAAEARLIWPAVFVVLWSIAFFAAALALSYAVVSRIW